MSSSAKPKFSAGDKVFAKVRGYPPWPARVEGSADETPNKMKYHVYFYGTGETAVVKSEDISDFVENKVKLGKPKKHKNFTEALHQIEAELSTDQLERLHEIEANAKDQSANISGNESMIDDSSKRASLPNKSKTSLSPTPKVQVKPKESKKRKYDEVNNDDIEKKKSSSSDNESNSVKTPEVLSRSGRKIKPKRFADYENDSGEENQTIPKPVSKVAPRIQVEADNEKPTENDNPTDYITANIGNETVKIPLDVEKPPNLEPDGEGQWNSKVRSYALQLKKRVESGEVPSSTVKDNMYQWGREQARKSMMINSRTAVDDAKQDHLVTEGVMLELDLGIRGALNIRNADPAKCIDLLDQLIGLKLTPVMLKKHPDIVQTIKKVRRYIGYVPAALTQEQETEFHRNTEIIRSKAELIYSKFQSLFQVPNQKSFWEYFEHEKDRFYHLTKDMSTEEIINLVDDIC